MKPKSIELLAFDRNHNLQYEGKCKLRIDKLSSLLLVEPVNEEFKMISAMFKWNFVMNKNIVFVFGEHELNDFTLIFDDEKRCKKVHDIVVKNTAQNFDVKELIYKRFLYPVCEKIGKNDGTTCELITILTQWIDKCENEEKEDYIKLLKEKNIYEIIYPQKKLKEKARVQYFASYSSNYMDNIGKSSRIRKRRCYENQEYHGNGNTLIPRKKHKSITSYPLCINQNQFKFVNSKHGAHRKLLIFTTAGKKHCYEYSWSYKRNLYCCRWCKNHGKEVAAISDTNENGLECIIMESTKHLCTPILYIAGKYTEMKILKKPDYEILENCNSAFGKLLIIFDKNEQNQCWEFRPNKGQRSFTCRKCGTFAKLVNADTEGEYVKLNKSIHKCKTRPYNRQNDYEFNEFVLSPDFEIRNIFLLGKKRKRLIIFDKNDKNLCHLYFFTRNYFYCDRCYSKKLIVSAKLLQNSDGEDYVILSKTKHICELRPYSEVSIKQNILHPPAFELMENTSNGVKKIFTFDSNDRTLCYLFTEEKINRNRYVCTGCANIRKQKDKNAKEVFLRLCKDENGKNYVQLDDKSHVCKPRKYEPEKYAKKESHKSYDYFFLRSKKYPNSVNVAIYHPEDSSLCFKLNYNRSESQFLCHACSAKRKRCNARIEKDENAKEYFYHDYKKHVCKPLEVSSIQTPEFAILKRNEINVEEKTKKKPEIDKNRIIKLPNFELHPNKKGKENGILFIFHSENRYRYCFIGKDNRYRCSKKICTATAKFQIQENGEQCVVMQKKEHTCQPC